MTDKIETVPDDAEVTTDTYAEPVEVNSGRVITDGFNVRVNTEVAAHAANNNTNVQFVDKTTGETRQLPLDEYVALQGQNGL
jgi:hypothetical protein